MNCTGRILLVKEQGIEVKDRGRVPADVLEQYRRGVGTLAVPDTARRAATASRPVPLGASCAGSPNRTRAGLSISQSVTPRPVTSSPALLDR